MISYRIDPSKKYYVTSLSLSGLVFEISANYEHPLFYLSSAVDNKTAVNKNYGIFSLIF